ncbi:MAG: hypothetical protein PSX71_02975 [bacterium]|nr:hypothetical protein [bacterium]
MLGKLWGLIAGTRSFLSAILCGWQGAFNGSIDAGSGAFIYFIASFYCGGVDSCMIVLAGNSVGAECHDGICAIHGGGSGFEGINAQCSWLLYAA